MATLINPEDPNRDPDSDSSLIARSVIAEQAACLSSYSFAPISPIVFTPKASVSEVIADRVSLCRALFVESAPQESVRFAPPEQVYANYATTAVPAALAVIRVRRTKFDDDPPLALAIIAYPSVLPFGHPQPVFDQTAPLTARFEPGGMIPPSDGGTYPLLGSFLHSNRTTELGSEASFRSSFLDGAVVLWGAKAFSHVLAPLSAVGLQPDSPHMDSLSDYVGSLSSLSSRCPASDLCLDSERAVEPDSYIRLPVMLPLVAPSLLPPGIIGDPLLGVRGISAISLEFYRHFHQHGLQDPFTDAWLTAVSADPSRFAIDTSAYADLAWTVNVDHPSLLPFASPWTEDLWWGMERTLSFRLLLDTVMQFVGDNKRPRQAFLSYLKKTHQGLYLPDSPFGAKPVELAFELLYLRPPQVAKWASSFALKTWPLDSAPDYIKVFKVIPVSASEPTHHPWERADGKPIPRLARVEKFDPPVSPIALTVYSPDDPRIVSIEADTSPEKPERDVLQRLAAIVHRSRSTQRTEEEQQSDDDSRNALRKQLECFRRGVLDRNSRTAGNPNVLSPVPVANEPAQDHRCPEGIDDDPSSDDVQQASPDDPPATDALAWFASSTPFRERRRPAHRPGLLRNMARKSVPPPFRRPREERRIFKLPSPPSSDPEDELFASGDEWDVERPVQPPVAAARPPDVKRDRGTQRPQPRLEQQWPAERAAVPSTRGASNAHLFCSPPRKQQRMAEFTNVAAATGMSSTTAHRLRGPAVMGIQQGEPPAPDSHAWPSTFGSHPQAAGQASQPAVLSRQPSSVCHRWSLDDASSSTPDSFRFWSYLLMYNDRDFQGHFSTGSRAQTAVLPDDAWFPATLPLPFRERFLADTKSDNVVSFINQYSVDAERAAQTAVYQSSTLPAASPSLGANLATELVDAMRSGNWSCSSYFRITVPPTLKPFSAWSFLTTLADISLPLLPPRGLSHTEVVACLSNLWWVLSTPLQCGSTAQMFRELPAVVDNTPLLRGLGLLINLLSRSTRGPFGSLADYWSDCSAEEKNSLAYRALTDADKLLDIFCVFIRPHSGTYPSIRRAVATDRPPTEWTLVNPALSDSPTVNWLSHHDQDNITTLPQFTAAWETNVVAFWRDVHCRDRTVSLGRAPAAFVSTQPSSAYDERQHRSYEDSSPLTKREGLRSIQCSNSKDSFRDHL
jgi:hypothetical protein